MRLRAAANYTYTDSSPRCFCIYKVGTARLITHEDRHDLWVDFPDGENHLICTYHPKHLAHARRDVERLNDPHGDDWLPEDEHEPQRASEIEELAHDAGETDFIAD